MNKGILTGCNEAHEWMLKWWWTHYTKHNDYPVAFCDFGMSKSARLWCEQKGTVLTPKRHNFMKQPDSTLVSKWKNLHPDDTTTQRPIWFYKPLLLDATPFDQTIWIDVDAEVKQSLASLFDILNQTQNGFAACEDVPRGISLRREQGLLHADENAYLAGVIAFTKSSPILKKWVKTCINRNHLFFSEQDALNRTLFEENLSITTLPSRFNYAPCTDCPLPENLVIYHHPFSHGKKNILEAL